MRQVIAIPFEKEKESINLLTHYEWIAMVIQKVLNKIVDKMRKDIEFSDGDKITIYEVSLTFFAVVKQGNYFMFSDCNVLNLHI